MLDSLAPKSRDSPKDRIVIEVMGRLLPQYLSLLISLISLVYLIRILVVTKFDYVITLFAVGTWIVVLTNTLFYVYILFLNTAHPLIATLSAVRSLVNVTILGVYIVMAYYIIIVGKKQWTGHQ